MNYFIENSILEIPDYIKIDVDNIEHKIIQSNFSKLLPSWLRVIMFNLQVSLIKGNKFYFSLDRIICPDIYRAGDGVHKVFLTFEKKSNQSYLTL